jgi:tRNA pseudouridine38-40 synthase
MNEAVALLTQYNDFRAFCVTPAVYKNTLCKVTSAKLFVDANGDKLRFQISANRFLGRMIRLIVGKLLEIGKGEMSVEEFESYLITKEPPRDFDVAYPQGLYLSKVTYPYLDIPMRADFSTILQNAGSEWREIHQ